MSGIIERGAEAMKARRRELIAQPLDRIWPDLMRAAVEAMPGGGAAVLRAALEQILDHCSNSGRGNEMVDGRIVERVEETALAAVEAMREPDRHMVDTVQPGPAATCPCARCLDADWGASTGQTAFPPSRRRMVVCQTCGNKRCPHATDHNLTCTQSNEPGQAGSAYA